MKITHSDLQSQSSSFAYSRDYRHVQLSQSVAHPTQSTSAPSASTQVELSAQASTLQAVFGNDSSTEITDVKLGLLISLIERLTGQKVTLFDAQQLSRANAPAAAAQSGSQTATPDAASTAQQVQWSFQFSSTSVHEESESTRYSAAGSVSTADGRQIDFALDMSMERYERQESTVEISAGNAPRKDPLVLNLTASQVSLQAQRFQFDLNGDGSKESIAKLGSGSFFLAMDRNGNGQIDNGKELFGPTTNNGFQELQALDEDHNGWIDENDSAWSELRVWRPGEKAMTLKEAGVGALAVQSKATPYTLKSDGQITGAVRSTGVFLTEAGQARSLQQIDLTV